MINLFKGKNKDVVYEQLAKTNVKMENILEDKTKEISFLSQKLKTMTEDGDYWKSEYEKLINESSPADIKFAQEVRHWVARKMLHSMENSIELQKLKDRVDYANPEEAFEILEKAAAIKKEGEILRELGDIILEVMNKD